MAVRCTSNTGCKSRQLHVPLLELISSVILKFYLNNFADFEIPESEKEKEKKKSMCKLCCFHTLLRKYCDGNIE